MYYPCYLLGNTEKIIVFFLFLSFLLFLSSLISPDIIILTSFVQCSKMLNKNATFAGTIAGSLVIVRAVSLLNSND